MTMIKFTAYKILMISGLFKFFEFEVLRLEFCGGFVAMPPNESHSLDVFTKPLIPGLVIKQWRQDEAG